MANQANKRDKRRKASRRAEQKGFLRRNIRPPAVFSGGEAAGGRENAKPQPFAAGNRTRPNGNEM